MPDLASLKADAEKLSELVNRIATDAEIVPIPAVQSIAKIIAAATAELDTLLKDV
jgi:hypothetical protein